MKHNYRLCEIARTTYGIENIVVQVSNSQEQERFRRLGAITFNPVLDRVAIFTLLGRNPDLYRLLTDADDDQEAVEVTVRNRNYTGRALRHLDLPGGLLVLGIRREGEFLVPHGNTQLHPGDRLTLLGSMQAVKQARRTIASVGDR